MGTDIRAENNRAPAQIHEVRAYTAPGYPPCTEFMVYAGNRLIRTCPSRGMAEEIAGAHEAYITHYSVTNRINGRVSTYKTSAAATKAMDRMDREYGAVICSRRAHWSDDAK